MVVGVLLAAPTTGRATGPGSPFVVPRLHIHTTLARDLAHGPWLWWHDKDTVMVAGHDVTPVPGFGAHGPFWNLPEMRRGDLLRIGAVVYRVRWSLRMLPSDARWAKRWTGAVLSGCWPRYSATYRWVVLARPLGWPS